VGWLSALVAYGPNLLIQRDLYHSQNAIDSRNSKTRIIVGEITVAMPTYGDLPTETTFEFSRCAPVEGFAANSGGDHALALASSREAGRMAMCFLSALA
jgi:hypothetical protein